MIASEREQLELTESRKAVAKRVVKQRHCNLIRHTASVSLLNRPNPFYKLSLPPHRLAKEENEGERKAETSANRKLSIFPIPSFFHRLLLSLS